MAKKSDGPSQEGFPRKFGKYHLLSPLAQGGMGALYLAITGERGFERLLVIKTVLPHLADAEYIARFRDEAKVVVKLNHGNLVPVFDAGQVGGELFMAMDFVEGRDLRAIWNACAKQGVAFPVEVAVHIVKELARGLGYAHALADIELVHRDVSPPNVLVSYSGEVKLTDFGLASSTLKLEKTAPGIIYGKVAYMSPEQARGDKLDGRSDLYAAGIILWELLTGRQLFPPSSDQPKDLTARAGNPVVDPPSKRAPRVPAELDAICLRALAPDPADRYPTGEAFRDALGEWLAKYAPGTDAATLEQFLQRLFADDIELEREQRLALIDQTRESIKTLPPGHELRRVLEERASQYGRRATDRPKPLPSVSKPGKPPPAGPGATIVTDKKDAVTDVAVAASVSPDEEPADLLGKVIDGRYRIEELIGEGGMGQVYLAEHVEIGKRVAVKVLHDVYSRMPDLVERFRQEARAASRIGHPHIVDVTDSGRTDDGAVYFVMEYLEGVELANVIDREGALPVNRALRIVAQICRALAAAHQVGIIHRDLKPENVFLTVREGSSDFVKVLDFGIAKSIEAEEAREKRLTHPGMAMGTPEYMAPEQAAGKLADQRCDVYAVGAILYEMLTGTAPYTGDNFMEILTKKATVDPAPPIELRPELPELVNDLVMQAMARSPDGRPPSMEALEYELTKCLSGRGAAVAKILGMRGLSRGDETPLRPDAPARDRRPSDNAPAVAPSSDSGRASVVVADFGSGPASATGPMPLSRDPLETADMPVPAVTSPLFRIIGWGLFTVLIVIAIGAILYVASQEQEHPSIRIRTSGSSKEQKSEVDKAPPPPTRQVDRSSNRTHKRQPQTRRSEAAAPKAERVNKTVSSETAGAAVVVPAGDGPPATKAEAEHILAAAKKAASNHRWSDARLLFGRLRQATSKVHRAAGYEGVARASFELKDFDRAIEAAEKALRQGAGIPSRRILANSYFRKGDFDQAVKHYELLLKRKPGDREATQLLEQAQKRQAK